MHLQAVALLFYCSYGPKGGVHGEVQLTPWSHQSPIQRSHPRDNALLLFHTRIERVQHFHQVPARLYGPVDSAACPPHVRAQVSMRVQLHRADCTANLKRRLDDMCNGLRWQYFEA